jgi:ferritin-like metal-binding protein YciE
MASSLKELLEVELKDAYDFEHRLVDALEEMASKVSNPDLEKGFERHREQTLRQIERLETAFEALGTKPEREECAGIQGLISEFEEFVEEENPSDEILNVFAAGGAIKTEHYEIVHYASLIGLANQMGLNEVAAPLRENLNEEMATAKDVEGLLGKLMAEAPK